MPASSSAPRRRVPAWVWWVCGGVVALCLLLALLVGGLVALGWGEFRQQAQEALEREPAVREHLGTIEEIELDFLATGNAPGRDEFVFRVQGERGKGVVQAVFVSLGAEAEHVTEGRLCLDDGDCHALGEADVPL